MAKSKKSNSRLGTRLRASFAEAYGQRGRFRSHLWYVYSPKAKRDFVLHSDLEFAHYVLAESDPKVKIANYAPNPRFTRFEDNAAGTIFDAEADMVDDTIELREVKPEGEIAKQQESRAYRQLQIQAQIARERTSDLRTVKHVVLTEREILDGNEQRLLNWMRVMPWIAQVRTWPLEGYGAQVADLVKAKQSVSLGEILSMRSDGHGALYLAAAFVGVMTGRFTSDLAEVELSYETRFCAKKRVGS